MFRLLICHLALVAVFGLFLNQASLDARLYSQGARSDNDKIPVPWTFECGKTSSRRSNQHRVYPNKANKVVKSAQFPSLVFLDTEQGYDNLHHCPGVLISDHHVLTSAMCADGSVRLDLKTGDGERVASGLKFCPGGPQYFGIMKSEKPITFSDKLQPACLPPPLDRTVTPVLDPKQQKFTMVSDIKAEEPRLYKDLDYEDLFTTTSDTKLGAIDAVPTEDKSKPEDTWWSFKSGDGLAEACWGDSGAPVYSQPEGDTRQTVWGIYREPNRNKLKSFCNNVFYVVSIGDVLNETLTAIQNC